MSKIICKFAPLKNYLTPQRYKNFAKQTNFKHTKKVLIKSKDKSSFKNFAYRWRVDRD